MRAEDEPALHRFFSSLSLDSRSFRFFSGATNLQDTARRLVDVDYTGRYGLIAVRGGGDELIGHGLYIGQPHEAAEVAFAIADGMQGRGLATLLLAHLAEVAVENEVPLFYAEVMPENWRMLEVFRESGFPTETSSAPGVIRVEMPTSFSAEAVEQFERRDQLAAQAAVRRFLMPKAVAVVGASRHRETVGGSIFRNLLESGFDGTVYPVNPASDVVQSVRAYRSIADGSRRDRPCRDRRAGRRPWSTWRPSAPVSAFQP